MIRSVPEAERITREMQDGWVARHKDRYDPRRARAKGNISAQLREMAGSIPGAFEGKQAYISRPPSYSRTRAWH
jgi:hypothetical protein